MPTFKYSVPFLVAALLFVACQSSVTPMDIETDDGWLAIHLLHELLAGLWNTPIFFTLEEQ